MRARTPHQAFRFTAEQIEKIQASQRRFAAGDLKLVGVDGESVERVKQLVSPTYVAPYSVAPEQTYKASGCKSESDPTTRNERSAESVRAEKINRLKAIHESSQSLDVIYI